MKSSPMTCSRRALLALGAAIACAVSLPALAERGGDGHGRRADEDRGGRQERMVPIRRDDGEYDRRDDRRMRRLSPEERRQLKQDLRDAERDFYREEHRRRR